jgi:hypothetical protein
VLFCVYAPARALVRSCVCNVLLIAFFSMDVQVNLPTLSGILCAIMQIR